MDSVKSLLRSIPWKRWDALKFKAIVLDLDGTLLHSNRSVSPENLKALRECVDIGLDIWIATARSYRTVFDETGPLFGIDFVKPKGVFHNGAYAVNKLNGYLKHYPIQQELVTEILDLAEAVEPNIRIALQNKEDHSFRFTEPETMEFWACTQDECIDYQKARTLPASKIAIWDTTRDLTSFFDILRTRFEESVNIFLSDSNTWILIMSKTASKEQALLDILSHHRISPDEVVTFGDGQNDFGMIQTFGCGIAMGNAVSNLKDAAMYTTLSNDEHGVSYALREILGLI